MRGSRANKTSYIKIGVVIAVLVLLVFVGIFIVKKMDEGRMWSDQQPAAPSLEYNGQEYVLNENVETFLITVLDDIDEEAMSNAYKSDKLADFLMLLVFDTQSEQCVAIHIDRDTMADVNILDVAGNKIDAVTQQIAFAPAYGNGRNISCRNTSNAVSALLGGIKVDHYIAINSDAIAVLTDLVGGVEVEVLDDFSAIDSTLVKGETVTLNGEQTLTYVHAIKGVEDGNNAARMKRQQQYINALRRSMKNGITADAAFVVDLSLKMSDDIISDRSVLQLQTFAAKFSQYDFSGIKQLEGTSRAGAQYTEFYPDEAAVKQITVEYFYKPKA